VAKLAPTTGMVNWLPSVPWVTSVRNGWPSLKITTATAPAAWAFATLTEKLQLPRWMTAMLPGVKPAKSAASQPLVELLSVGPGGIWTSTNWAGAVTFPVPEKVKVAVG
jgi:hypothetical protein